MAEQLVPGKKRRKLSELVTNFFCLEELPADVEADMRLAANGSQSQE